MSPVSVLHKAASAVGSLDCLQNPISSWFQLLLVSRRQVGTLERKISLSRYSHNLITFSHINIYFANWARFCLCESLYSCSRCTPPSVKLPLSWLSATKCQRHRINSMILVFLKFCCLSERIYCMHCIHNRSLTTPVRHSVPRTILLDWKFGKCDQFWLLHCIILM